MRALAGFQMIQERREYGHCIKGVIPLSELLKYVHRKNGQEIWAYRTMRTGVEGYDVVGPGGGISWWTKELFEKVYKPCL